MLFRSMLLRPSGIKSIAVEIDLIDLTGDNEGSCYFCLVYLFRLWATMMEKQVDYSKAMVSGDKSNILVAD